MAEGLNADDLAGMTPLQVVGVLLCIHAARLWPIPDDPFDPSEWYDTITPEDWQNHV